VQDPILLAEFAVVDDDFDLDDLLDDAAGRALGEALVYDVAVPDQGPEAVTITSLIEAIFAKKKYDEHKHPRWPPGTKNAKGQNIGGQFMRVGQRFLDKHGDEWEVAHVVKGRVYANRADVNLGNPAANAETRAFDPVKDPDGGQSIPDVKPADPHVIKGGKSGFTTPVIDPYVDSSTHDPSIPVPAGSPLTAEQWKRFGRVDQEHYTDLVERFGEWKPGAVKGAWKKIEKEYDQTLRSLVEDAFGSQAGSSSGWTVSLTSMFHSLTGKSAAVASAFELRERAKELQGDLANAVQWDLYHRTGAPDVAIFHKTPDAPSTWVNQFMHGGKAVFSGLSQSTHYRSGFWDSVALATPVAVRHITASENSVHWSSFGMAENEAIVADSYKIDERSVAFGDPGSYGPSPKLTPQQAKWLEGVTSEPKSGQVIADLIANMKGEGSLSLPPAPPSITMHGSGGVLYVPPPPGAAEATKNWKLPDENDSGISPQDMLAMKKAGNFDPEFAVPDDNGAPSALPASEQHFQPGDYMIGKKGAFYWVGPDPGSSSNLRYWKIVNGKFNGESWELTNDRKAYRLVGPDGFTFKPPPPKSESSSSFNPEDWVSGGKEEYVGKLKKGDKFKVQGSFWELQVDGSMQEGQAQIKDLQSGKLAFINTDYKPAKLVPTDGSGTKTAAEPEQAPALKFKVGDTVIGLYYAGGPAYLATVESLPDATKIGYAVKLPNGSVAHYAEAQLSVAPSVHVSAYDAKAGDVFAKDGTKHTVTSVLKDGTFNAKAQGASKVEKFSPGDVDALFRPDDWVHDPGSKLAIGDAPVGGLVDMAAGAKLKPTLITGKHGSWVDWTDLSTGMTGKSLAKKQVRKIVAKGEIDVTAPQQTPADPVAAVAEGKFDPGKYMDGPKVAFDDMPVGAFWTLAISENVYQKTAPDKVVTVWGPKIGTEYPYSGTSTMLQTLVPKAGSEVPYGELKQGDLVKVSALKLGDHLQFTSGSAIYQVTGFGPDDEQPHVKIKAVVPGGAVSGDEGDLPPDTLVVLHAKTGTTLPPSNEPAAAGDYPDAVEAGFVPYKSKYGTGGKTIYPKLSEMTVGTHFKGKDGKEWIVKQSGPDVIVSDGEKNHSVNGSLRAKLLDSHGLVDSAPPVGMQPGAAETKPSGEPTIPFPHTVGKTVLAADLPSMTVGVTDGGTLAYKGLSGSWFQIGANEGVSPKSVTPVSVDVDPAGMTQAGTVPVHEVPPGGVFEMAFGSKKDAFVTLGGSDDALHVKKLTGENAGNVYLLFPTSSFWTKDATVLQAPADDSLEGYLGDEFWPDGVPLPKVGDAVLFTTPDGHESGVVQSVATTADGMSHFNMKLSSGAWVSVDESDLVRPLGSPVSELSPSDKVPTPHVPGTYAGNVWPTYGDIPAGTVLDTPTSTVTVMKHEGGYTTIKNNVSGAELPMSSNLVTGIGLKIPASTEPSPTGVDAASLLPPSGWSPFKSDYGSGGKYKHMPLSSLAPGTVFTDKSKTKYTLLSGTGAFATFTDGVNTHAVSPNDKVKVMGRAPKAASGPDAQALEHELLSWGGKGELTPVPGFVVTYDVDAPLDGTPYQVTAPDKQHFEAHNAQGAAAWIVEKYNSPMAPAEPPTPVEPEHPGAMSSGTDSFNAIQFGAYFEHDGTIYQKGGGGKGQVVVKADGSPHPDVGSMVSFVGSAGAAGPEVTHLKPEYVKGLQGALPEAKTWKVAEMHQGKVGDVFTFPDGQATITKVPAEKYGTKYSAYEASIPGEGVKGYTSALTAKSAILSEKHTGGAEGSGGRVGPQEGVDGDGVEGVSGGEGVPVSVGREGREGPGDEVQGQVDSGLCVL
jgi:hypothetical protein